MFFYLQMNVFNIYGHDVPSICSASYVMDLSSVNGKS